VEDNLIVTVGEDILIVMVEDILMMRKDKLKECILIVMVGDIPHLFEVDNLLVVVGIR